MFESFKKKKLIKKEIQKRGAFIDVHSSKIMNDLDFALYHIPKEMIKGLEIYESIYDIEKNSNQIILNNTMNAIDIKREIGHFIFNKNRASEIEDITTRLIANDLVDTNMVTESHSIKSQKQLFKQINADIFAVFYGNPKMTDSEISIALNSLYMKDFKEFESRNKYNLFDFVDDLFV